MYEFSFFLRDDNYFPTAKAFSHLSRKLRAKVSCSFARGRLGELVTVGRDKENDGACLAVQLKQSNFLSH